MKDMDWFSYLFNCQKFKSPRKNVKFFKKDPVKMQKKSNSWLKSLKLDKTSKIKLTLNKYVTNLKDADTTHSNIDLNGYKLYVNGVEINK